MMPNPVDLRARHFPLNKDPSKYQVADSMAAVCGGGVCQVKQPSSCEGGAGTRKTRSPLLRKMYRLIPEIRDSNSSAPLGGSGQPPNRGREPASETVLKRTLSFQADLPAHKRNVEALDLRFPGL